MKLEQEVAMKEKLKDESANYVTNSNAFPRVFFAVTKDSISG